MAYLSKATFGSPILIRFDRASWLAYYPIALRKLKNFLARGGSLLSVGAWLSLVERTVRDREVGGSNPLAPTKLLTISR